MPTKENQYYPANTGVGRLTNKIVDYKLTKEFDKMRNNLIAQGWNPDKIEEFYGFENAKREALKENALKSDIASSIGSFIPVYGTALTTADLITDIYSKAKGNPNVTNGDIFLDAVGMLPFVKPISRLAKTKAPKIGTKLKVILPLNSTVKEVEDVERAAKFYNNTVGVAKSIDAATDSFDREYEQGGKIPKFKELSNKDRYRIIRMGVQNGIHSVSDIEHVFDSGGDIDDPILKDRKPKAEFYKRVQDPKESITDWETGLPATHKMAYVTDDDGAIVYPEVQKINGKLVDFTRPPYKEGAGFESAMQRGDTIRMTPKEAKYWTQHYKEFYPGFKKY